MWGDFSRCVAAAHTGDVHLVYSQLAFYLSSASLVAWSQGRVRGALSVLQSITSQVDGCFGSSQDHQS